MTTGGNRKELTASIFAGSEELFDVYCQPCSIDNVHREARSFCQDCQEHLCETCITFHRKVSATRHHTLSDISSIPKTKFTPKVKDELTERCPTHQDKVLEYFCNAHSDLCCSVCLNMNHRNCSMSYIPEVSGRISSSQEYRQVKADVEEFVSMVTSHQKHIKIGSQNNEEYYAKAIAGIKEFKKEMNKMLDKLEEDAVKNVSMLNDENIEKLTKTSEKCQSLLTSAKQISSRLEENFKLRNNNQLFVEVKLYQNRMAGYKDEFHSAKTNKISGYAFHQDETLQDMVSSLSRIWSLSVRKDAADTKCIYIKDVNVKSKDDRKKSSISGIAVLAGDRIAVTDFDNKALKLVDVKHDNIVCRVSLKSEPFGVTAVEEDQLAVLLGNKSTVEIFTVSNTLTKVHTIDASCVDFEYKKGNFFSIDVHPGAVKIINMAGKVLSTFCAGDDGKPLLTMPARIALSHDNDVMYITDSEEHTVTCMTTGGKVIWIYTHDELVDPTGVAVDADDYVYVCGCDTDTVHMLTPTGTLIQILLGQENGLAAFPDVIAHDNKGGKLYISSTSKSREDCNNVKMFQFV